MKSVVDVSNLRNLIMQVIIEIALFQIVISYLKMVTC